MRHYLESVHAVVIIKIKIKMRSFSDYWDSKTMTSELIRGTKKRTQREKEKAEQRRQRMKL